MAEEQKINYDLLSDEDLYYLSNGSYDQMSDDALKYVSGEGFGTAETMTHVAGRAATETGRFLSNFIPGITVDPEQDLADERRRRMMEESNTGTSVVANLLGAVADPFFIPTAAVAPIKLGGKVATMTAKGAVTGAAYGAAAPIYEELGDSRLKNAAIGAATGGVLGNVGGWFSKWMNKKGAETMGELSPTNQADMLKTAPQKEFDTFVEESQKAFDDQKLKGVEAPKVAGMSEQEFGQMIDGVKQARDLPAASDNPLTGGLRYNKETDSIDQIEMVTPDIEWKLPRDLRGASPRMGQLKLNWANDLDRALYIIGNSTTRSARHNDFVDWVKSVTKLSNQDVEALAKQARKEVIDGVRAGRSEQKTDVFDVGLTPTSKMVINNATKPVEVVKPYNPPSTTVVLDALRPRELDFLKQVGNIELVQTKNGKALFRKNDTKQFLSPAQVDNLLAKVGVKYERKPKKIELDETGDLLAPKQGGSVGAMGTRPSSLYGRELQTGLKDVPEEEFRLRMAADQPTTGLSAKETEVGKLDEVRQQARNLRKRIERGYNDIMDWVIKEKKDITQMSNIEIEAVKPFVKQAQKEREAIANELTRLVNIGSDLDTYDVAKLYEDLLYYHSIDLWWRDQGTRVARALAQRRNFKAKVAQKKKVNLFPGVSC